MEALGIDIKLLIAQIVNFALFFFIFKRFMAKPFSKYLKDEKHKEDERERLLKEVSERESKLSSQEQEALQQAQDESTKIIQDAKKTALKLSEEIIAKAHKEAEVTRKKAQEQGKEEINKMREEVRKHLIDTSALLTKKVLSEFVTSDKQDEVFKKLINGLDKKDIYEN